MKKVLSYYIQRDLISQSQFIAVKVRAIRLWETIVTNKSRISDCVKEYIIKVLSREANKRGSEKKGRQNKHMENERVDLGGLDSAYAIG